MRALDQAITAPRIQSVSIHPHIPSNTAIACSIVRFHVWFIGDLEALDRAGQQPGPGSYKYPDFIGPQSPTKLHSRVKTPHQPSIPKAFDRFQLPSKQFMAIIIIFVLESVLVSPGPGKYSTLDCFTYNNASQYESIGKTKFAQEERQVFRMQIKNGQEQPGPGNYQIVGEFGSYQPPSFR